MIKKGSHGIIVWSFLLTAIFFMGCAKDSDTATTEESTSEEPIALFMEYTNLKEATLIGEEEVALEYTSNGWTASNGELIDQDTTNNLMTGLIQLNGIVVDKTEAKPILTEETFLTTTVTNEDKEEKKVEFIEDKDGEVYAVDSEETVYQLTRFPDELKQISFIMLQKSMELISEDLKEIRYSDENSTFVLNQETSLSDVETSPFISGWFLHSDLQTEFSIEYNQMQQLLAALTSIKGNKSEAVEPETFSSPIQIDLIGNEDQETLLIGADVKSENYTYVKLESNQSVYQVPNVLIEQLTLQPAELVDNFIALLPLTAVESIEIVADEEKTMIEAKHDVIDNEESQLEIASDIFINGTQVDTEAFRKTYQYLAMLSYEEELENYTIPNGEVEGEISVLYTFKDNGDILTNYIRFIPYQEGEYVVIKNGVSEFTTSIGQLETMLQQIALLIEN
ncbi:DUF4340 domain-containing protein [Desemzia sp. RIT804]|uniref:DUF4340 domain-containing protein n=1 Tax=Desemzia sp. RIT 804 TaxID=2810209 RepID=UPI00194E0936|nr:DUF4340 domain-containing protein [Desemzia sp. RIT 804]MBM6614486.1 DUF4340 domain-containing protein [Desemzia sp. RIT 804]